MPAPTAQPLRLSDEQITTIMALSRPLQPDQRVAFFELLTSKLNGRDEIGDGQLYQLRRDLQRKFFTPPDLGDNGKRGVPQHERKNFVRRSAIEA
jgi:hypothetical protein